MKIAPTVVEELFFTGFYGISGQEEEIAYKTLIRRNEEVCH